MIALNGIRADVDKFMSHLINFKCQENKRASRCSTPTQQNIFPDKFKQQQQRLNACLILVESQKDVHYTYVGLIFKELFIISI